MLPRVEKDALGTREVPAGAYYGIQTLRARENFPISGFLPPPELIRASAQIKLAAARANQALGLLDNRIAAAIIQAAGEVVDGRWHEHFVVDAFQAGAGTSHNMNTNEVLANRAAELLGGVKGDYRLVHPNDHVNLSQSSNDYFPTVIRLTSLALLGPLLTALRELESALNAKAQEFDGVLKTGRTHLEDAVPIRLGQEFSGYAASIRRAGERLEEVKSTLGEINLGATAAGTGMGSPAAYRQAIVAQLIEATGFDLRPAANYFEVTQSTAAFAELSSALKLLALELIRIANDLRLLSSGPRTGLGEINLPSVQPGSSIMPGKVNPSIPEALNMIAFQVVGNDHAVALATQAGQLDLNVMTPVIAFNLTLSLRILRSGIETFCRKCVQGITVNPERCRELAEASLGLATALSPFIGYERAAEVAQEAQRRGLTVREVVQEKKLLTPEQIAQAFDLRRLTEPG